MQDVNNDGFLDIYVCKVGAFNSLNAQNQLYINNGNLTFTESAKKLGVAFSGFSTQAAFLDYDKDGDLDFYLLNHNIHSVRSYGTIKNRTDQDPLAGDRFFENKINEIGHFVDVTEQSQIYSSPLGYGLAIGISDFNKDGWMDLYITNDLFNALKSLRNLTASSPVRGSSLPFAFTNIGLIHILESYLFSFSLPSFSFSFTVAITAGTSLLGV